MRVYLRRHIQACDERKMILICLSVPTFGFNAYAQQKPVTEAQKRWKQVLEILPHIFTTNDMWRVKLLLLYGGGRKVRQH